MIIIIDQAIKLFIVNQNEILLCCPKICYEKGMEHRALLGQNADNPFQDMTPNAQNVYSFILQFLEEKNQKNAIEKAMKMLYNKFD